MEPLSDCRQSASGNSQARSAFPILGAKIVYLSLFLAESSLINPFWAFILASFFRFIHAKVSPTFISIRAFPNICVYRNPWFSFAVPKIRSIVSFLTAYNSFMPSVWRISSHISMYGSQMCLVTTFTWSLLSVHCER